jgi:tetratricopeptide (TPR) repeat protein
LVASQNFDKAIRLNPKYTLAYLENGNVDLEMRRTDAAKMNFVKVTELEPGNVSASNQLIDLYFSYHQYQYALDLAQKCTACTNNEKTIALCYFKLQDYDNAEKILVKLAKANPNDAVIMYTVGKVYMEMELEQKAIYYYQKAVALDGTNATAAFELGMLYFVTDNYKNAVIFFNKATALGFPPSAEFTENLGYAYLYSGEFEKGEKILLSIHDKKRGDKDIMRDLAQAYFEHRMYDKSLEFCQKLMELDVKDGKALYQAGLCFQKKGDMERGMQMCDKAIELDPSLRGLKTKKGGDL